MQPSGIHGGLKRPRWYGTLPGQGSEVATPTLKQPLVEDLERSPHRLERRSNPLALRRPSDLTAYRRRVAIRGEIVIQDWGESGEVLASLPQEARPGRVELAMGVMCLF